MSVSRAAALVIAQLGIAAFFIAGVTRSALGDSAGWFVLGVAMLSGLIRAIDIESWALLIPGGLISRVRHAFGPGVSRLAAAVALVDRLLLGALACVLIGHYAASVSVIAIAGRRFTGYVRPEDFATLLAVAAIGLLWVRARIGHDIGREAMARGVWIGIGILALIMVWGVTTLARGAIVTPLGPPPFSMAVTGWSSVDAALIYVLGVALTLPVIGSGEVLARAAREVQPPRVQALRRTALLTVFFALAVVALGTFLFILLVPAAEQPLWIDAPLAGLAQHLAGPSWARDLIALAVAVAAVLVLLPAAHAALADGEQLLQRGSVDGTVPSGLASLHTRFGTPANAVDVTAAAMILIVIASGGRVAWLSRAYGASLAVMLVLTIAALARLRRTHAGTLPFTTPFNLRVGGRQLPVGLLVPSLIVGGSVLVALATGDVAAIAAVGLVGALALWFNAGSRKVAPLAVGEERDVFDLLTEAELSLDQIEARPGNVLVPVRNPHALVHLLAALHDSGDRDVVVMTVRMLGVDGTDEAANESTPTAYERGLFSEVVAVAERHGRPVRLLIVPTHNVVEAIVATILRLRSSDVYVGESSTLPPQIKPACSAMRGNGRPSPNPSTFDS